MKDMARDTVDLLRHIGWTEERSVNVIGHSMGGMIAIELVSILVNFTTCFSVQIAKKQFTGKLTYCLESTLPSRNRTLGQMLSTLVQTKADAREFLPCRCQYEFVLPISYLTC